MSCIVQRRSIGTRATYVAHTNKAVTSRHPNQARKTLEAFFGQAATSTLRRYAGFRAPYLPGGILPELNGFQQWHVE